MRLRRWCIPLFPLAFLSSGVAGAQSAPAQSAPAPAPQTLAQKPGSVIITLDDAIRLALEHNHSLLATRTTIQQSQAEEVTANLRPDPVLLGDIQFLPLFDPSQFSSNYVDNTAQFDLGVSYLFERGKKRQHRLQAAKDVTAQTRSQVADTERSLTFNVASQYINVELAESSLALAQQDLKSFQNTVDIAEARYKAGDTSEDDLLKIKLQMLQFQQDVSAGELARVQGLSDLRQLLGYESVAADYDVAPNFDYQAVGGNLEDFEAKALQNRPDLRAEQQGVSAANSQYQLQKAIGKRDITGQASYTHIQYSELSLFAQMPLPIFDRNQGEIARAGYAVTQAQEQEKFAQGQVLTDVKDSFENLRSNDKIVGLYRSGYLDQAQQSRDINQYAYQRGAASLLDFLDAERSYRAVQLAYRQALASYLLAIEQMRQAVGTRSLP
ncbi:MAG TPA: TolC family protein [Acidobacteriaceae bacterium]|jgi:cobalt-zinc-cadmium efflux system outer membrane protein|nr:TolC family protein [Acidobacteriaceae bacterium]